MNQKRATKLGLDEMVQKTREERKDQAQKDMERLAKGTKLSLHDVKGDYARV